jgi:hypothetical protein
MSNFLTFATVTEAIRQKLDAALKADIGSDARAVAVRPGPPDPNRQPDVGVTVYLYQVTTSGHRQNEELPVRSQSGSVVQRPRAAFDLHYLFSFFAGESELKLQRVMGCVMRVLHTHPVVTRKMIDDAKMLPELVDSDLGDEAELVKLSPEPLSLDELSKLWSVFFQSPYVLSVPYRASIVMLDGRPVPVSVLPVKTRNIYVKPFEEPTIERVLSRSGPDEPADEDQPILPGYILVLEGRHLSADVTLVRVVGDTVAPDVAGPTRIEMTLAEPPFPAGVLRAGLQPVQVVHQLLMGTPETAHKGFESNVVPLILHPVAENATYVVVHHPPDPDTYQVEMDVTPKLGTGQKAMMTLNGYSPPGLGSYAFPVPPDQAGSGSSHIVVPVAGVADGTYFIRLSVDGAESLLELEGPNPGPTVTVPAP